MVFKRGRIDQKELMMMMVVTCEARAGLSISSLRYCAMSKEHDKQADHDTREQAHSYVLFKCDEVGVYVKVRHELVYQENNYQRQKEIENLLMRRLHCNSYHYRGLFSDLQTVFILCSYMGCFFLLICLCDCGLFVICTCDCRAVFGYPF